MGADLPLSSIVKVDEADEPAMLVQSVAADCSNSDPDDAHDEESGRAGVVGEQSGRRARSLVIEESTGYEPTW